MKVWILTKEYNCYDQYGDYFVAAFKELPSLEKLANVMRVSDEHKSFLLHVQSGGGRQKGEDMWYNLDEYELL